MNTQTFLLWIHKICHCKYTNWHMANHQLSHCEYTSWHIANHQLSHCEYTSWHMANHQLPHCEYTSWHMANHQLPHCEYTSWLTKLICADISRIYFNFTSRYNISNKSWITEAFRMNSFIIDGYYVNTSQYWFAAFLLWSHFVVSCIASVAPWCGIDQYWASVVLWFLSYTCQCCPHVAEVILFHN